MAGNGYIHGTLGIGIASTTGGGNLIVKGYATTSSLVISNTCTGCLSGYEQITNTGSGPTSAGASASVTATCSAGKSVIGGGGSRTDVSETLYLRNSNPSATNAWTVTFTCQTAGSCGASTMTAYAICARP
jgi:hypothetical protein